MNITQISLIVFQFIRLKKLRGRTDALHQRYAGPPGCHDAPGASTGRSMRTTVQKPRPEKKKENRLQSSCSFVLPPEGRVWLSSGFPHAPRALLSSPRIYSQTPRAESGSLGFVIISKGHVQLSLGFPLAPEGRVRLSSFLLPRLPF